MSILVGKAAPDFTAPAVLGNGSLVETFTLSSLRGHYVVLLFYPLNFTFVCPTEIIAHSRRISQFHERSAEVVGVSIDSHYAHLAWRNLPLDQGGIGPIKFPLVADVRREIVQAYGVEHPSGVALRGSFLIDREGFVQHQVVNNLPLGRNADEMLRMIDALKFFETHGDVCPAGWKDGQEGMDASAEGVAAYLSRHAGSL